DDPIRFFGQGFGKGFGVGADDFEVEQDHPQLFQLVLDALVGDPDEFAGILEDGVRVLLHIVEALDDALQFFEIDFGDVEYGRKLREDLPKIVPNVGDRRIEVRGRSIEADYEV